VDRCGAGAQLCSGLSPLIFDGSLSAVGSYLNFRRLPWPTKVIAVTFVGLPPVDKSYGNFRQQDLADGNSLISVGFPSSR
jgi:hypothetical protein